MVYNFRCVADYVSDSYTLVSYTDSYTFADSIQCSSNIHSFVVYLHDGLIHTVSVVSSTRVRFQTNKES